MQVKPASGAAAPPARSVLLSTWCAEGVGVVRRIETDASAVVSNERLVAWDGDSTGLGGFEPTSPLHGLSGTNFPWLPPAWAVAAVDSGNGALAVMPSMRMGDTSGITVAQFNRRGHLTGVQELPAMLPPTLDTLRPLLLPAGAGAALLVPEPRGLSGTSNLRLRRLGADGRLLDTGSTLMAIGASAPSNISVATQ